VKRAIPLLACLVAGFLAFVSSGAQAAGAAQALGFTLHRTTAATVALPHYHTTAPIAVHVGGKAAHLPPALVVTAHGPDGSDITVPLVRTGDSFDGALNLSTPGQWTIALSSRLGSVSSALADVPLDVVSDDDADLAARCAFALSAALIVAGLALLLRTRARPIAYAFSKRS
jgi:hypothetical protein